MKKKTVQVAFREVHPFHGLGWMHRERPGWVVWNFFSPDVAIVVFSSTIRNEDVLTLYIPVCADGTLGEDWRSTMSENWLERAAAAEAALEGDVFLEDGEFEKKFPALAAFMLKAVDPSTGKPRLAAKVTIFADQGHWKCSLSDGNTEHSLFATLEKPQDAFQALNKALQAAKPDWRAWRKGPAPGTKRKS